MFHYLASQIYIYLDGWRLQVLGLRLRFPVMLSISRLSDEYIISCGLKLLMLSYTYKSYDACWL